MEWRLTKQNDMREEQLLAFEKARYVEKNDTLSFFVFHYHMSLAALLSYAGLRTAATPGALEFIHFV